jgi:DNA-binding NtrC family response regulator
MNTRERILVVDDEHIVLMGFEGVLKRAGFEVTSVAEAREAKKLLESNDYDLVLTDLVLNDEDGIAVLKKSKEVNPEAVVIVITGFASVSSAIEALQRGAFDYIIKPCEDEELLIRVRRGLERRRMEREIKEKEIQEERLKAIAQTAVTVNDQINTPLNVIQASTEFLRGAVSKKDSSIQESLGFIESEVTKIKEVVSRLTRIVDPRITEYALQEITMVDLDRSKVKGGSKVSAKQLDGLKDKDSKYRILVVDDEEFMLYSLSKLLGVMGFETVTAGNGEAALKVLESEAIDLVITDVNMPGMSGIELLKKIKRNNSEMPVIIITGFGIEKAQAMAKENKADGFLPKPFRMNDIRGMIDKVLVGSIAQKN